MIRSVTPPPLPLSPYPPPSPPNILWLELKKASIALTSTNVNSITHILLCAFTTHRTHQYEPFDGTCHRVWSQGGCLLHPLADRCEAFTGECVNTQHPAGAKSTLRRCILTQSWVTGIYEYKTPWRDFKTRLEDTHTEMYTITCTVTLHYNTM